MSNRLFCHEYNKSDQITKLLVSVRSVTEAYEALAGGADVIDIKEPANGPLGAASFKAIKQIAQCVTDESPRTPITVALGELELSSLDRFIATQIAPIAEISEIVALKVGLAGLKDQPWQSGLAELKQSIETQPGGCELVAVAYADDEVANSPTAEQVFSAANRLGLRGFLIDTYHKEKSPKSLNPGLLGTISQDRLAELFEVVHLMEITVAVAGSLNLDQIEAMMLLKPDIIGVRGAACEGGRAGTVSRDKVKAMRNRIKELINS